LAERWRRPVIPIDVTQVSQGLWLPDGRVQGDVQLVLTEEDIARMRAGYVCGKCLEPFEEAWPERCPVCGAPVRTEQAAQFAREFGGEVHVGPSTTIAEEMGMLEEHRRKDEERERREEASL
jgi:hypothetical protein